MAKQTGIVNIRGREYKTVALRVEEFRTEHPVDAGWAITTELLQCESSGVLVKATISTPDGKVVATGHAQEYWEGQINKTSAVENCETSAIGRALAAAGLAGHEFASADEVAVAIGQQRAGHSNRPPTVTANDIDRLKVSWFETHKEEIGDLDQEGKRFQFALWVRQHTDRQADWNVGDYTQWRPEDLAACEDAIKKGK